jgi:TIR domain
VGAPHTSRQDGESKAVNSAARELSVGPARKPRVFVSYAGADGPFAKSIADTLTCYGKADAWYDQYEIRIGNSILQKINEGLLECEYGIVLLSRTYLSSDWPMQELGALVQLIKDHRLFPVRHNLSPEELRSLMPTLGDIRSGTTEGLDGIRATVSEISRGMAGDRPTDDRGRLLYFRETVSIGGFPLDEQLCVSGVSFEECVIQGPAMLTLRNSRRPQKRNSFRDVFQDCYWNQPNTFLPVVPGYPVVGSIGVRDTVFRRCRFKYVGITAPADDIDFYWELARTNPAGGDLPDWLQ